ncbi:site-specific integrase [Paraburkholderia dilworthii]|uniref:Site-specific integrase n=1 Tax=Paraburkholderia dilworthii TaxID=948106 RepID=A0ABW9D518_9BURK
MAKPKTYTFKNVYDRGASFQVKLMHDGHKLGESFPYVADDVASKDEAFSRAVAFVQKSSANLVAGRPANHGEDYKGTLRPYMKRYRNEVTAKKKGTIAETNRIDQLLDTEGGGLANSARLLDIPLKNLNADHFQVWRDEAKATRGYENATLNSYLSIWSSVLDWVHDTDASRRWLVNGAKGHRLPVRDARERTADDGDVESILALTGSAPTRLGVRLLIETGARRSEIAALPWEDVDLTLDRKRKRWPNITFRDTKNGESRTIPLTLESVALLDAIPMTERYGYVLKSPLNTRERPRAIRADAISKAWIRGRDRVEEKNPGIQGLRLHDLRHTALTRLAEQVQDTILLSAISGHKDPKMLKRYVNPKPAGLAAMFGFDKPPAKKRAARKTKAAA